jgi:hypothetical protein
VNLSSEAAMQAKFRGYGVQIDGELQNVSFAESFDAEDWIKRAVTGTQWRDGVQIKIVRVIVSLAEDQI